MSETEEPGGLAADGQEHRLDPGWVTVERLSGAIALAIVAGLSLVGALLLAVFGSFAWPLRLLPLVVWLIGTSLVGALVLGMPPVRYRYISYRLNDEELTIRRGIFWRNITAVPRSRVQHTDVSQGPLERHFGLATLIVYTAGTQHAAVQLDGLPHATALEIRDHLIEGGADDAV